MPAKNAYVQRRVDCCRPARSEGSGLLRSASLIWRALLVVLVMLVVHLFDLGLGIYSVLMDERRCIK
jgi:hypothetical protein